MHKQELNRDLVVGAGLLLAFFAIPHLIDDFLFGIPIEFGLTNQVAQLLSGVFAVMMIASIVLAARKLKAGYFVSLFIGIFLALAGCLRHIPKMIQPGPYWSGWFSELLIYGLIGSSLLLVVASILAIRSSGD